MTDKHVLFDSKVDFVSSPTHWVTADFDGLNSVPSSGELGWPLVSLAKENHAECARFGLRAHSCKSTRKGRSDYNYGYATAERPDKVGIFAFSNEDLSIDDGSSSCAWVHNPQRRWIVACWTSIALLSLLILAALAMILVFCIIIPRSPYLEVPNHAILVQTFEVTRIGALLQNKSSLQPDEPPGGQMSTRLSARFTVELVAKNPNRVPTGYSSTRFSVTYGDTVLGESTVAAFSQKAHSSIPMKQVVLIVDQVNVLQQNALSLLTDANVNDSVPLRFDGHLTAWLRILGMPSPPVLIHLRCRVNIIVKERQVTDQQCNLVIERFIK